MEISKFRQLDYFLKQGKIPRLEFLNKSSIDFELGFFIGIENGFPLYEASTLPYQSLKRNWEDNYRSIENIIAYLEETWRIEVDYNENYIDLFLDNEILYDLRKEFSHLPTVCCPIYLVTIGEGDYERVVYIGKTSSKKNRFKGGHSVALKLHHPKYSGIKKNIYFASVMLLGTDNEYVPLEFMSTLNGAEKMLLEVEASLIYHYNPELNIMNKKRANYDIDSQIHIQNFSDYSDFLNDKFIQV